MNTALSTLRAEEHISVSALGTYLRCPRQYQHRYIFKTPAEHRSSALAFGSAVHKALAHYYSALQRIDPEPGAEELATVFRDDWAFQLEDPVPVLFGDKETPDGLTDTGVTMLSVFLENAPRHSGVVEVEMPWSVELWNKDYETLSRLVGVFDAVVRDESGTYRILEHKTGARKWSEDKLAFDSQITAYSLVAPLVGLGDAPVMIQLLTKTKTPAFELYEPKRTEADKNDFSLLAMGVTKAIKAGVFYPVRDWHCRSCEFSSLCIAG